MKSPEGYLSLRRLVAYGSSVILGSLAVLVFTGNPVVSALMVVSAILMGFAVLHATSSLRIAAAVLGLTVVWIVGWLGLRSLGVVP